ncbi:hypothetical protein L1887_38438 [Cichorium endivia]|nr:hypothetical protein L1887_38438 [Cichorium endivia]
MDSMENNGNKSNSDSCMRSLLSWIEASSSISIDQNCRRINRVFNSHLLSPSPSLSLPTGERKLLPQSLSCYLS